MISLINSWVGIQARVDYDPVDEFIHDGRDIIYTPQPLIKTWLILISHLMPPCFSFLFFDVSDVKYN